MQADRVVALGLSRAGLSQWLAICILRHKTYLRRSSPSVVGQAGTLAVKSSEVVCPLWWRRRHADETSQSLDWREVESASSSKSKFMVLDVWEVERRGKLDDVSSAVTMAMSQPSSGGAKKTLFTWSTQQNLTLPFHLNKSGLIAITFLLVVSSRFSLLENVSGNRVETFLTVDPLFLINLFQLFDVCFIFFQM